MAIKVQDTTVIDDSRNLTNIQAIDETTEFAIFLAGFTKNTGDITSVVAGNGLTGGSNSGQAILSVGSGSGITVSADSVSIDTNVVTTLTGTQTLTNKTVEKVILDNGYTEQVHTVSDGVSVVLDPNNGSIQLWTLGANRTPTQANWASGQSITLLISDGSARTIDWSTLNVQWKTDGGSAPILETISRTVIVLWKVSTIIYGARVGDA